MQKIFTSVHEVLPMSELFCLYHHTKSYQGQVFLLCANPECPHSEKPTSLDKCVNCSHTLCEIPPDGGDFSGFKIKSGSAPTPISTSTPKPTKMTNQPRMMPNGEIHYTQRGKEPPMDVRGYKRKAPKGPDAWKFAPDFPPCVHRTISLWQRGCGNVGVHIVCNRTKAACKHEDWNPCPRLSPAKTS